MWSDLVVCLSSLRSHDLSLQDIIPHLSAQHLFHENPVEPFLPILPSRAQRYRASLASLAPNAAQNCSVSGDVLEVNNGTLDSMEIDASQTAYVCGR